LLISFHAQADGSLKHEYRSDYTYIAHFVDHMFYNGGVKSDVLIVALVRELVLLLPSAAVITTLRAPGFSGSLG
jgi:hypothetical protein